MGMVHCARDKVRTPSFKSIRSKADQGRGKTLEQMDKVFHNDSAHRDLKAKEEILELLLPTTAVRSANASSTKIGGQDAQVEKV